MKKIPLLAIIALSINANAQAPNWVWAKRAGGIYGDAVQSIYRDHSSESLYITGSFMNDTIIWGSDTLMNTGGLDVFIAKYNLSGNVLWAKSAIGNDYDVGYDVTTDGAGNVYLAGYFTGSTITFGSDTLTNVNYGWHDVYVVKYDSSGKVLWAKSAGGNDYDLAQSIVSDKSGNVYVTGHFLSPTITFGNITLTNVSSYDIFIAKYDSSGNVLWAKSAGGGDDDHCFGIAIDSNSNLFITGAFRSPYLNFGNISLANTSVGYFDIYIAKYDSSGNALWAKSAGGNKDDATINIAIDKSANIYISGNFYSDSISISNNTLINTNPGTGDILIAKYDSSGNELWAKSVGGNYEDVGYDITTDGNENENIYLAGHFENSTINFDSYTLTNSGNSDLFIACYNTSGNVLWAKSAGGSGIDRCYSVATDLSRDIYIAGGFQSAALAFGNDTLINSGQEDAFIAKLGHILEISETNNENKLILFPNPTTGKFTISSSDNITNIEIYNVLGERIYKSAIHNPQSSIDLSNHPSGIYIIRLISGNKSYSEKFIVSK